MREEDLWSDIADDLSSAIPSNSAPKQAITTAAINDVGKPTSKTGNGNEAILHVHLSPGPMQPPTPLTPLPPAQPILENLWDETPDTSITAGLLAPITPVIESLPGLEQETTDSEDTLGEHASPESAPEEEADDLFEVDLWGVLEDEEDEDSEATFEGESSDILDELETPPLQDGLDDPADWLAAPSSAEEITSDFFAALEQATPLHNIDSSKDSDTLFEGFKLLDIEAELAEQERLEAEAAAQPAETEVIRARGGWGASGWMGNSSILYINWEDESKAEQEALERLGYAALTISQDTRAFIIQAARSAILTGRREKKLTSELADARTRLAQLPDLTHSETTLTVLQKEIAALERKLLSAHLREPEQQHLSIQLSNARCALTQIINEINTDPYKAERNALKAAIADLERQLVSLLQWVAVKKATHFLGQGIELDDLIQIGMLGVIAGIRHFDRSRNTRLLVVVNWWVFQAFTRALADYGSLIRLPVYVYETLAQIEKQRSELEWLLGRPPTHQEIAAEVNLPVERVDELFQVQRRVISLNRYIDAEQAHEGYSFQPVQEAFVLGEDSISYDVEVESREQSINSSLNCLTLRERQVIKLRFGLFNCEEHTLEEVGRRLKVTRERVRQIEDRAIRKLSHPMVSRLLKGYRD